MKNEKITSSPVPGMDAGGQPTCSEYRKTIDKTTYVVKVHFNELSKETMEDKIKRMLRNDVLSGEVE